MTYARLTYDGGHVKYMSAVESAEVNQGALVISYEGDGARRSLTVAKDKWIDFELIEEESDNA